MSEQRQKVKLGEVLRRSDEFIDLQADAEYREITVKLWGKGVVLRGTTTGGEIAASRRVVARHNQFILSRIDARNGALGIVPKDLDGAIVSNDFPLFNLVSDRLLPAYLGWMCRSEDFVEECKRSSEGTTNRVRLKEDVFLARVINLPPLEEQQRIVERIEELVSEINEAKRLRKQAVDELEALVSSASARLFEPGIDWKTLAIGDFCEPSQYGYTESSTDQPIGPRFLRITDIQNGRVDWERVPFCHCPDPQKYLLKPNDIVFARTGATTGKSFVIRDCPEAVFASYLIRLRVRDTVLVDYLYRYFQSPSYWKQISEEKKGTGQPNLNGSKLEKLNVPVPSLPEQQRIVAELDALHAKVDLLKRLQADTAAELDAMTPSILDKAFKGGL